MQCVPAAKFTRGAFSANIVKEYRVAALFVKTLCKLRHVPPRTVRPSRTQHTLRVQPVVAVVRPARVVGEEPRPALLALLADHVARGVTQALQPEC